MSEPPRPRSEQGSTEVSDLIGVRLTLSLAVWLLVVLAAFFLIGVVVGLIVLFAGVIGFGWALVAAVRSADTTG